MMSSIQKGNTMNRKLLLTAACTSLTMISGAALGTQTNTYPDGVASQHELNMQDVARSMINSLTPAEKEVIAQSGGIGSDALNLSGFTWDQDESRERRAVPEGSTATEFLEMLLSDEMRNELSEQELTILYNIASVMDDGTEVPFFCFAPDTNPKYAMMVNDLLDYQFVSTDGSRFQQGNRWSGTATDGTGLNQGDPTTITYSFVPDGTSIPNTGLGSGNSTLFNWLDGRYGSTAVWQELFHGVFDRWAEITGLSYVWEQNDDGRTLSSRSGQLGVRGDVRISAFNYPFDGNNGVLAYNFFPNDGDMAIDAFDSFYNSTAGNSLRLRNVIAHEHGHGLGMAHVCPAIGTKLMEPFVSTGYDGPQLDDKLNGQRHYGDPLEPNDSIADATDLGIHDASSIASVNEVSLDDNNDFDFFKLTLSERARIIFAVSPNASTYQSGPQTQACNSGSNINYNAINDIQVRLYSASDLVTPVATADDTGTGGSETIVYESQAPGDYYLIVSPVTSVNNVQRYIASLITQSLPPVVCPADLTGDGVLNFFDVSAFLNAFGSMDPIADFTNDGQFNFFDVSAFLNAFSAGCP